MPRHRFESVTTKTDNYTATLGDSVILCNGTFTVTLPASVSGREYIIKNIGTGVITIDGDGSQTIDGDTTIDISTQYESVTLQGDGSNWSII